MNVLFDINVVLDIVGNRLPFYGDSHAALLKTVEIGATPMLAMHAFPTLYYLLGSVETRAVRVELMEWIFETFGVAEEGGSELSATRGYGINDFEDALVAAAAVSAGCDCIITRNIKDFAESPVRAISPTDFLEEKKRCGEMTAVNLAPSLQSSAMKRRFNNE